MLPFLSIQITAHYTQTNKTKKKINDQHKTVTTHELRSGQKEVFGKKKIYRVSATEKSTRLNVNTEWFSNLYGGIGLAASICRPIIHSSIRTSGGWCYFVRFCFLLSLRFIWNRVCVRNVCISYCRQCRSFDVLLVCAPPEDSARTL